MLPNSPKKTGKARKSEKAKKYNLPNGLEFAKKLEEKYKEEQKLEEDKKIAESKKFAEEKILEKAKKITEAKLLADAAEEFWKEVNASEKLKFSRPDCLTENFLKKTVKNPGNLLELISCEEELKLRKAKQKEVDLIKLEFSKDFKVDFTEKKANKSDKKKSTKKNKKNFNTTFTNTIPIISERNNKMPKNSENNSEEEKYLPKSQSSQRINALQYRRNMKELSEENQIILEIFLQNCKEDKEFAKNISDDLTEKKRLKYKKKKEKKEEKERADWK